MTQLWRTAGVALGRNWVAVLIGIAVVTAALLFGLTQIEFATGQDSYLNPDSQAALDNVEFQDEFGGETVVLLFSAQDGRDITELFNVTTTPTILIIRPDGVIDSAMVTADSTFGATIERKKREILGS